MNEKQKRRLARKRFLKARSAEKAYQRQLSTISTRIDTIIKIHAPHGRVPDLATLQAALTRYAEVLKPWARTVTERMHADVSKRDALSWMELAREMGGILRKEIFTTPTGSIMREALNSQVELITSLPLTAARRVHRLALEAQVSSGRADEMAAEIMKTGRVTLAQARTIARTETSRTASLLLESRAGTVGSTHYVWHTVGDSDVRPEHRRLDGRIFEWTKPPVAGSAGERANPGCIYNCRCWAEPILADAAVALKRPIRKAA
jgi:SPP1 gp7 family putative phage head morphogenesis protein